jgi:hypothetical protein
LAVDSSDIESNVSSLERLDSKTLTLGNSGLLSLDGETSTFAVYSKLLNGLEWSKKVRSQTINIQIKINSQLA